ncbi:MAG: energy-coupled thiamine transporter ThiT [Oscillospiraceae bacterium]|nr:energy-coupled thiamine transporter ThiT [Oscillospiraceae bacterium]
MEISKTRKLTEAAIMIALATVLSYIQVFTLPMGGSITAFSQVPIVIIGFRHGAKWGTFSGMVYGLLQMLLQGLGNFAYVKGMAAYLILIFMDYLIAFAVLGLGGAIFRKSIKNQSLAIGAGAAAASAMRFICHFISGVTIWGDYAEGWSGVWVYSLTYNGSYMLAECIVTVIGTAALALAVDFRSADLKRKKTGVSA